LSSIADNIAKFRPISLNEMDSVALMNRTDTKYQVSLGNVEKALEELKEHYQVLEIAGSRTFKYKTIYFDTKDKHLLNEHLRGKLNRTKVRAREYVGSNTRFFELKLKTNKGLTRKSRIAKQDDLSKIMPDEAAFLSSASSLNAEILVPAIEILFERITLVSTVFKERITIDSGLSFSCNGEKETVEHLGIIEVKRDSESEPHTPILKTLKKLSVYPESMSKYCLGMVLLDKTKRYNNYKPKLLKLNKLALDGNIR